MGGGGYLVQQEGESRGEGEVFYEAPEQTEGPHQGHTEGQLTRAMTDSMTTTVPLSMLPHDLTLRHQPSRSWRLHPDTLSTQSMCCQVTLLLVVVQCLLGVVITALAIYMQVFSTAYGVKECPYWAGIPLTLAGVFSMYQCARDQTMYSGSNKLYILKCVSSTLTILSSCLCLVAAVFSGYHTYTILSFTTCYPTTPPSHCYCTQDDTDPLAQIIVYNVKSCDLIDSEVILLITVQCGLNLIAGILSFIRVVLLWNSRYGNFYSGLKFYSYAADTPPHPWFDPSRPPYTTGSDMSSARQPRLTVRQASTSVGSVQT